MRGNRAATGEVVFDKRLLDELQERLKYAPEGESVIEEGISSGQGPTRWTLSRIRASFNWLRDYSLSGIWRLLRRKRIRLRHGRPQQFSPDPEYSAKEEALLQILRKVAADPHQKVLLFVDEFTYYHWPLPASDWCAQDGPAPQAQRAAPGERKRRIVGGLQAMTGQVVYRQANKIGQDTFLAFLRQVARTFDHVTTIYLVVDNWPVHSADLITDKLQTELPQLQLFFLPTYAPWLNPIEKLWDWLKAFVLKQHRLAGQWQELVAEVTKFMDQFEHDSAILLQRVGLKGEGKLASALITPFDSQN